ncbi:xylulokinase [Treponema parvum]|uniref:Xylulose kinase n=1 Tax=Treponema parvum TaxID=138851 RepID=A0A975EYP7_9SPIR|nr:xylulokinase [Treponema parvum]QTQ11152.1 xylulokinase [Treponema parvum]QTQ16907.1 xylulokinase [Treponema parvum]
MKTVAGIDLGTQSMKIVIYDYAERKEVIKTSAKIDMIAENAGTREQKTQWYKDALKSCFERIPSEIRASIRALGVSGQQHGFIALDKNAEPVYNIKLWNDSTTLQECKALTKKLGGDEKVIEEAGNVIIPSFTAGKILWLKEHKKEAFDAMRYIMLPHDYVNFLLTGNYVMEYGDASGTLLLNAKKHIWSKKICDAIDPGLYEKLPPLISPDKAAGTVCKKASEEFGIPEGIVVSSGGGDNMMGAIGTGTVEEGILTMSMGTSGTLYGYSDNLVADPLNGISGFCSSTGGYLPLLCTMNCTVVTEYTRNLFGLNVKDFDEEAAKAVPGADGVFIMPYLNGERFPHLPHGKCSIEGLTAGNYKRENICRAALESAAFAMKGGIELFEKLGFKAKEIRLIGGGAKSAIWRQITADIMGFPIVMPLYDEAAALGAALQALYVLELSEGKKVSIASLCAEHVKINGTASTVPNPQNRKAYDARYDDYRTMLGCLSGLYK